ncbi:unnamed protein product [Sphagnum jensenii]|uniref:SBP-type domain-containing protein n=1 Tax=Sphagnum jensenii TaxID=128206 RepID=A0ABP1A4X2_9BRYO
MTSSAITSDHEGDPNWTTVNYGDLEAWGNLHPSTSATKNVLGLSGIPGLALSGRAGLQSNLLSSFAHQRYLESYRGMQHLNPNMVKREPGSQAGNQHSIGVSMNGGKTQETDYDFPPVSPMLYDLMQRALTKTSHATTVVAQDNARSYTERATVAAQAIVLSGRTFEERYRAGSPGSQVPMCLVEGCNADLSTAKDYHRRHKVCEFHSKALNVVVCGEVQRFCQQCSRFHFPSEFDDGKRSCMKRLADHHRRRRKAQLSALTCDAAVECIGMKGEENSDPSDSPATVEDSWKSRLAQFWKRRVVRRAARALDDPAGKRTYEESYSQVM